MAWPQTTLDDDETDADLDTVTGVGGGREQLNDAIIRLNLLKDEAVALLDEAQTYTSKRTITMNTNGLELRASGVSGALAYINGNHATPTVRTARVGMINATELIFENEVTNGDFDLRTDGTGIGKLNGSQILTNAS